MYCVVLNPVDAFLNRKAKSGVRKIEVAELGLGDQAVVCIIP